MLNKYDHFSLAHFEGTLDFLLCLIRKEEMDITAVPIHEIIQQFINKLQDSENEGLERGAEFIGTASYLLWLKSKVLIPSPESSHEIEEMMEDPHFEIIHHLLDYCRFKQAGKDLSRQFEKQQSTFSRRVEQPEWKKPMGIDHLTLEELSGVFSQILTRAPAVPLTIQEEVWRVGDKIRILRGLLEVDVQFPLLGLFTGHQSRHEIVVIFLAILELMKCGELCVVKDPISSAFTICSKEKENL
jgi:segregation and condensation protein A